jgi:CheY-like chemotaxis protein
MNAHDRQRILVIEDHECIAANLKLTLETQGHEVRTAPSGERGTEIAGSFLPTLILCDLTLPGMDGYAVARTLRRHPSLTQTRFIAMTGYLPDGSELCQAGFEHGLSKPFTSQELHRALAAPPAPAANRMS